MFCLNVLISKELSTPSPANASASNTPVVCNRPRQRGRSHAQSRTAIRKGGGGGTDMCGRRVVQMHVGAHVFQVRRQLARLQRSGTSCNRCTSRRSGSLLLGLLVLLRVWAWQRIPIRLPTSKSRNGGANAENGRVHSPLLIVALKDPKNAERNVKNPHTHKRWPPVGWGR